MAKRWKTKRNPQVQPAPQPMFRLSRDRLGLFIIGALVVLSMVLSSLFIALSG